MTVKTIGLIGAGHIGSQVARLATQHGYHAVGMQDIATVPTLVFCTVFGLSMDYEVFLVARVAEARQAGFAERAAIVEGLARTGRLITSAALIMNPNMTITLDSESATAVLHLVEALEELDDVNQVYHHLELTDALVAQYAKAGHRMAAPGGLRLAYEVPPVMETGLRGRGPGRVGLMP